MEQAWLGSRSEKYPQVDRKREKERERKELKMKGHAPPLILRVSSFKKKNLLSRERSKKMAALLVEREREKEIKIEIWGESVVVVWMQVSSVPLSLSPLWPSSSYIFNYSISLKKIGIEFPISQLVTSSSTTVFTIQIVDDDESLPHLLLQKTRSPPDDSRPGPATTTTLSLSLFHSGLEMRNPAATARSFKSKRDWDPKASITAQWIFFKGKHSRNSTISYFTINSSIFNQDRDLEERARAAGEESEAVLYIYKRTRDVMHSSHLFLLQDIPNCNRRQNVVRRANWMFVFNRARERRLYTSSGPSGRWYLTPPSILNSSKSGEMILLKNTV